MKFILSLCFGVLATCVQAQTIQLEDPCSGETPTVRTIELDPEPVDRYLRIPASGPFTADIAVYGTTGSEVTSLVASSQADANSIEIDLQLLPPGIYYIESHRGVRTILKD